MALVELELSCRAGRVYAAYLHLAPDQRARSVRCRTFADGTYVVDFNRAGKPLGIEIVSPSLATLKSFNAVLVELGLPKVTRKEIAPLLAA